MRIAINGLALSRTMSGIGRTTLHTLRALLAIDSESEYLLFLPSDAPEDLGLDAPNLECVRTDVALTQPLRSLLFEEFAIPMRLRGAKVDLYYAPSFLLPAFPGAATEVICVHDLAWRLFPETKSLLFRTYMNRRLPSALRRAARVVCVSDATARDLREQYALALADRVRVIHNGVDLATFRPDSTIRDEEAPFVAVVGNQDRRKNIGTLLEAFPIFRARMRPCRLVMVGPGEAPAAPPPAVDFLGYLGEQELVHLYRRALMVVQPSLYEGFGLPLLEAMACGTAVACADIPVFREVAGECAAYFDPKEKSSIAQVMGDLARDTERRADLERRGRERAESFPWSKTAHKLLDLFKEASA